MRLNTDTINKIKFAVANGKENTVNAIIAADPAADNLLTKLTASKYTLAIIVLYSVCIAGVSFVLSSIFC